MQILDVVQDIFTLNLALRPHFLQALLVHKAVLGRDGKVGTSGILALALSCSGDPLSLQRQRWSATMLYGRFSVGVRHRNRFLHVNLGKLIRFLVILG